MRNEDNINLIVQKLKTGSEEAFDIIYNTHKDLVFFVIISILKDWQLSEEIMQDTFLRMYNNIDKYYSHNFKAWLLTIARNLAINEYNKRKLSVEYNDNISNEICVENKNTYDLIKDLKMFLDDDEFEVVILYIVYNLKHREIAKAMNKPLGTVLWLYRKALRKLKNNYYNRRD
ncbi:MAG: sigma-70 family RNA polymerase sigma factor [Bacilli bacterium]|nr:sigma-70 family RNA polymerase sigma factor [Bacilli bacterium]MDD4077413.1 sigma-70 family RNA polymerase sigma factor [Bacilli bacterium]